jgi:hypothetical protein
MIVPGANFWHKCRGLTLDGNNNSDLMCLYIYIHITEGSLEVKLLTTWTHETAEVGRVREEEGRRKKIREE